METLLSLQFFLKFKYIRKVKLHLKRKRERERWIETASALTGEVTIHHIITYISVKVN